MRRIILAAVLAWALPAGASCDGEGCPGDYGQWRENQAQREERERFTKPDHERDGETRRRFNDAPAAFDPRAGQDSSSPRMWNQFGPDGQFMTCQRGFNNAVYCF